MEMIFGADDLVAELISERLGVQFHPPYVCIGFMREGQAVGGALFNDFNGSNIEMTLCVSRWTRGIARAMAHYTFVQAGCNRVTAKTRRVNRDICRQLQRSGFEFEGIMKRYYGPERADDAIVYRLDRETGMKRWLR